MTRSTVGALVGASLLLAAAAAAAPPVDAVDDAVAAFPERFEKAIDDNARAVAVAELGLLKDPRVVPVLKPHLAHESRLVRIAVARTLGEQKVSNVAPLLLAAFGKEEDRKEPDGEFLAALLEGVGEADPRRNFKPLSKAAWKWMEKDLSVCRAAAVGMARARTAEAVGELVDLLEKADTRRLDQTDGSPWEKDFELTVEVLSGELRKATGKEIKNVKDWRDWWRSNRKTWRPPSNLDEEKPKDPDLFTDPAGKYEVRRPSKAWAWREDKNLAVWAEMQVDGRMAADFEVRTESTSALAAQTPGAMADEWRPKLEERFKEIAKDGTRWDQKTKFAGVTAVVHEIHGRHRDYDVCTQRWVFLVKDGVSYRIMGVCKAGRGEQAWKEWEAFFASFRFEGK